MRKAKRRRALNGKSSGKRCVGRRVYYVVPHAKGWAIKVGVRNRCVRVTKKSAIDDARSMARSDWRKGHLAQVKVHRRDGTWQFENTYGADPKKTKG